MFIESSLRLAFLLRRSWKWISSFGFLVVLLCGFSLKVFPQQFNQPQYATTYQPSNNNYLRNSQVFRQEIARFQMTVERTGHAPMPVTQVPRVQEGDVLKVRLLDEAVGGIKLDQTRWDWTMLVAFINPLRRMTDEGEGSKNGTVSNEIQFRKTGWYREYSFTVPYDSQPVFFLYPRPQYRKQLMKVVSRKYEDLRKLGEKTIELAGAYSQINTFLNELQYVLNRNAQQYGFTYTPGTTPNNNNNNNNNNGYYSPYTPYNPNPYSPYNPYNPANPTNPNVPNQPNVPIFGLATVPMLNHIVEGLARSFNIQLPSCWGNGSSFGSSYGSNYGSMGTYSGSYNPGYSSGSYSGYSSYGGGLNNNQIMDFVSRAQCVAKNVSLEEFDVSVTRMWQQGGVFLMAELQKKYPQIAYWINIAAAAIDFIVKVFQKSPLRIVPTIVQSQDNPNLNASSYSNPNQGYNAMGGSGGGYQNSYQPSQYGNNPSTQPANNQNSNMGKVTLFADSQPSEGQFVTAYPIVVHKWQANPDPEVISLYPPILAEPCLHLGTNLLKSTDLEDHLSRDQYSQNFRVVLSSENGYKKEFPLRKNMGYGGWELNITAEDLQQIPKIKMNLEGELVGTRGFNEIKSPKFAVPIAQGGSWEITPESEKNFVVGGRRTITLRNSLGSCRCLQAVIYKPSFGGQFIFEAGSGGRNTNNQAGFQYSSDGKEVSIEIDTSSFQPGPGTLEIRTYGGETQSNQSFQMNQGGMGQPGANGQNAPNGNNLPLKLYPSAPIITEVKARRGDREILITGERLEQIQFINVNGKRAVVTRGRGEAGMGGQNSFFAQTPTQPQFPNQPQVQNYPTPNQGQIAPSPNTLSQIPGQYQNLAPNQRVAVFEDKTFRLNFDYLSLEIGLEDNRTFDYPNRFAVGISRPTIRATGNNEIDGIFVKDEGGRQRDEVIIQNQTVMVTAKNQKSKIKSQKSEISNSRPQIDLANYPIVLNDKNKLTIAVQNVLTDYNFRLENLSIETNIENATITPNDLPQVDFEVLDTNNLRINFNFNPTIIKALSGRRLQFRIKDRERGDSDWYVIKQTFVRIPQIESVKCTNEMNNQCELRGEGLDYIAQVSTDGGRNWFPQTNGTPLQVQPTAAGNLMMLIPMLINQKFLQIKLRDYPNTEGLTVTGFAYANTVKKVVEKTAKDKLNQPNQAEIPSGNQPVNQSFNQNPNQANQPLMNPTKNGNMNNGQPNSKPKADGKGGQNSKKRN